jgi:hypothetical protein
MEEIRFFFKNQGIVRNSMFREEASLGNGDWG